MKILALFFLGLVQGLTEFLPVSSSGHLVLFSKIFGIEESLFVSIILHVATLLSILVVFRKDVWQMIRHPFSKETMMIVVATIPTCVICLLLMPIIKMSFSGALLPICFFASAILLLTSEKVSKRSSQKDFSHKSAFLIGVAQGFAVFPGVSRSGTTISAGLLCGNKKEDVTKFSFLMSIPIILLSLLMEIFEIVVGGQAINVSVAGLCLAFVTAFVTGVLAIKMMIRLTKDSNLKYFGFYLILIAVVSLFVL